MMIFNFGETEYMPVFRAGDYGEKGNWPVKKLDEIVSTFDASWHEPPLVLGHPKTDDPAHGWVSAIKRVGDTLMVKFKDVTDDFKTMWGKRLFSKFSVSLAEGPDGKPYLRHVGALGGAVPEVKGLRPATFRDGEYKTFELNIGDSTETFSMKGRESMDEEKLKKLVQSAVSLAIVDAVTPMNKRINDLTAQLAQFAESEKDAKEPEEKQEQKQEEKKTEEKDSRYPEFAEKKVAAELAQTTAQVAKLTGDLARRDAADFAASLVAEGKLLPGQKTLAVELLSELSDSDTAEFSEGAGKKKFSHRSAFKAFLSSAPKVVDFGEKAAEKGGGNSGTFDEKARRDFYQANKAEMEKIISEDDFAKHGTVPA